jgi:threonine dehydrogenase-like Zn-dependent dehydrogenase
MMRAAITYGARDIRVESIPVPIAGPGEVVAQVEACGICGGDYSMHQVETQGMHQLQNPVIGGHEVVGTIIQCGLGSEGLSVGSRVVVSPNRPCRYCPTCRKGNAHLCPNRLAPDLSFGGGFAELIKVTSEQCYLLSESISFVEATLVEPLACCLHSLSRISIKPGESVAILGGGVNAQLFVQLSHISGARRVTVIDNIPFRLQLAKALGADEVLQVSSDGFPEVHQSLPEGADIIINTRGATEYTRHAIDLCATGGRILCYGVSKAGETVSIEPHLLWKKEIQLVGGRSFSDTFGSALQLISSGRIKVDSLVTRSVNLEGYVENVSLVSREHVKTVVLPKQADKKMRHEQAFKIT